MQGVSVDELQSLGLIREPAPKKDAGALGQEQCLSLMVAQLRNQDPFKPMESGEFLGQIAQFGTVSGINDLQASFDTFAGSMQSSQVLQGSSLVGRSVLVPVNIGSLQNGAPIKGALDLPSSATDVAVSIYDMSGQLIRRMDLGTHPAGPLPFSWDGTSGAGAPVPEGLYEIRAEAIAADGTLALQTQIEARVDSVTVGGSGDGLVLNLDGLGSFNFNEVTQVR